MRSFDGATGGSNPGWFIDYLVDIKDGLEVI